MRVQSSAQQQQPDAAVRRAFGMAEGRLKAAFKAPEGRYLLHSEKQVGLVPFAMRRTTRLTIATLHGGEEEGMYMIYNVGDYLHIAPFDATEKVGGSSTRASIMALCAAAPGSCSTVLHQAAAVTHRLIQLPQAGQQAAGEQPTCAAAHMRNCCGLHAGAHLLAHIQPISSARWLPLLPCLLSRA